MYNIYQSSRRKQIQYEVYTKSYITIPLFGTDYIATVKEKKIGRWTIRWIQILGLEFPDNQDYVKQEIRSLKQSLSKQFGTVFVQFGIINELTQFDNYINKQEGFIEQVKQQRIAKQNSLSLDFGLTASFRENMPLSNIIYDVTKTDEQLMSEMNSGCRERIKKAIKNSLNFRLAHPDEYDIFYQKRCDLGGKKGFNPISKKNYLDLIEYMHRHNTGSLFVAEKDGHIIAGSICMHDADRITYLYGFADRKYSNIGGHHFLKFKIFGRAREHGIAVCDMMGAAPTGFPQHPLTGVSTFKESLGGTKIEVWGNYDVVICPILYRLMKRIYYYKK